MFAKNRLFILSLLLFLLIAVIVIKSDIDFQVQATFGFKIAPFSHVQDPKIKARLLPEGVNEVIHFAESADTVHKLSPCAISTYGRAFFSFGGQG